jgi:hypothetical protein
MGFFDAQDQQKLKNQINQHDQGKQLKDIVLKNMKKKSNFTQLINDII